MTTRITEIPLSKLLPSPVNVRRMTSGSIDELAASIAAHGLLQSLHVHPQIAAGGSETGKYTVTGGGRRLAALKLLVTRKALPKGFAVPCVIGDGDAQEASLAENAVRENLHPADQFAAFHARATERGLGADEIAARFGVTAQVVRQRLRLAAVSPVLMQHYRGGDLTLDQLTAFAVTADHARQEAVYAALSYNREPSTIRHMLTEDQVKVTDRRVVFVSLENYLAAGGTVLRDLFTEDRGGWCEDVTLLDRLVHEKLDAAAVELRMQGWKWIEAVLDFPHAHGLRRVYPTQQPLPDDEQAKLETLRAEYDRLGEGYDDISDMPDDAAAALERCEAEIDTFAAKEWAYDPEILGRAGGFVSVGYDGMLRADLGFIRREDETSTPQAKADDDAAGEATSRERDEPADNPLPEALMRDLTAHLTLGLRAKLGEQPDVALTALVHQLAITVFHPYGSNESCLNLRASSVSLSGYADIAVSPAQAIIETRHEAWARELPDDLDALWDAIVAMPTERRLALLAHCVAVTIDAVRGSGATCPPPVATLARAVALDMADFWTPTGAGYFNRVPKKATLAVIREVAGEADADRLRDTKKPALVETATSLCAGHRWLPDALRI